MTKRNKASLEQSDEVGAVSAQAVSEQVVAEQAGAEREAADTADGESSLLVTY